MEGYGRDGADEDVASPTGDLFLRDEYGRERRCYVAAGTARLHGDGLSTGTDSSAVRELSPEAVHSIDRLSMLWQTITSISAQHSSWIQNQYRTVTKRKGS